MSSIYRLEIQYRGTRFSGWQIQNSGEVTIQGELEKALHQMAKGEVVKTVASGRTDAGVHAFAQVVRVEFPFEIDPEGLKKGINSLIDRDIKIIKAEKCPEDFHPIYSAHSKQYRYYFSINSDIPLFYRDRIVYFGDDLNIDLMKKACQQFIGEHDFMNFYTTGSNVKTTVRKISKCELIPFELHDLGDAQKSFSGYYLKIEGNGFLKQMVRMIMGALVQVGKNKVTSKQIDDSFKHKLAQPLAATAPAHGLHLNHVEY